MIANPDGLLGRRLQPLTGSPASALLSGNVEVSRPQGDPSMVSIQLVSHAMFLLWGAVFTSPKLFGDSVSRLSEGLCWVPSL